jgi:hypothetical protein
MARSKNDWLKQRYSYQEKIKVVKKRPGTAAAANTNRDSLQLYLTPESLKLDSDYKEFMENNVLSTK